MRSERISVSAPDLNGREAEYVGDAIASSWISSTGSYVDRFERDFASACGSRACIAVANGTVALHVALVALGLERGDEVILPSLTYVATANAVRYQDAEPVFVDVDPATWCLDTALVEEAITPRTRGIVAVDLYGHPADMDAVNTIAERHGFWVLEDAAEAFGASYRGRPAGSLATAGTFSFYGNKILTSGEGGAVTVSDPDLERRVRLYRGQGMDPDRRYYFPVIGYNYRLTNVSCALLCAQLERADAMLDRRRAIFAQYRAGLGDVPGIGFQPVADWADPAPWLFCITVDAGTLGVSRDDVMSRLADDGVETRPFFIPIHSLPPYVERPGAQRPLPVSDHLGAIGMNLPTSSAMVDDDVDRVIDAVRRAVIR